MKRKLVVVVCCEVLLLALMASGGRSKEESLQGQEAVYFPIVVDSKTNSYHILNDSFLREKLEYSKEKGHSETKQKSQYEIIPLNEKEVKSLIPSYSADPKAIRPQQIKSVSYKDTSINDKYKVYTGFLPGGSETKYYEEVPKYTVSDYLVHKSNQDSQHKPQNNRYIENPKDIDNYPSKVDNRYLENPKQESLVERYTENPKPYLESLQKGQYKDSHVERYTENPRRYPESSRNEQYKEPPVERYTENPRPYLESLNKKYPETPSKDSYKVPAVERYTENPRPAPESYRHSENPKQDSYKKSAERYPEKPRPYVESTTVKPSNRYNENPRPETYTAKPPTAVGFPVAGNRYTENPRPIIESYTTPKPYNPPRYVEESPKVAALESYRPKPYTEPPKYVERYTDKPRPVTQSYTPKPETYPVRYTENPKPSYNTYTPRPDIDTYQSTPANRYPDVPARYTENPKPYAEAPTPKPYVPKPKPSAYATPSPARYPETVQRYTENPRPAIESYTQPSVPKYSQNPRPDTKGYPRPPAPKYEGYTTTPSYPRRPSDEYQAIPKPYEKRPTGYKPLYGSNHQDGYEIYVPEEYDDDYSAIPGKAGIDYPVFDVPPYTYFNCGDQDYPGYYADVEARCQVFHICQADGRANAFLCPNGTLFNQQFFVCDWWYNVNCEYAPALYSLNARLYETPYQHY